MSARLRSRWRWALATGCLIAAGPLAGASATASAAPLGEPTLSRVGAEAIPRDVVASIAQDRTGFLWIGTGDGVVRYDGQRFRPLEREHPDPTMRNLGWVRAMLGARDGRLWIGTETDGLAVYDPATDRVHDHGGGGPPGPRPTIQALAEDADGRMWVGTLGGGLERFDPTTGRFAIWRVGLADEPLPDDRVFALQAADNGTLWLGTGQGLYRRAAEGSGFAPVFTAAGSTDPGLAGATVQALLLDRDGQLWAGTHQGRLARIDPATGQGRWLTGPGRAAPITSLAQASDGLVWVGRQAGVDLHDPSDGRWLRTLRHDPARPSGLAGNEVSSLLRDQAGALWVGGFGLGLQRAAPGTPALRLRRAERRPDGLFANPDARALLARPDGGLWAALNDGSVVAFDAALQVSRAVLPAATAPVEAMAQAANGGAWIGVADTVRLLAPDGRELRRLHHGAGRTHQLLPTADGSLWMATQDGLHRLAPGAGVPQRLARADGNPLRGEVFVLAQGPDGSLWVGGTQGLHVLAPGAERLHAVQSAHPDQTLGNPIVVGLLFDRQGRLWLDTAVTGLHRLLAWDGQQARFDRISVRHGVVNRPFGVNLLEDARGRLWTHMHLYDPGTDRLHALTAADGAALGTGWFRAYARLADGRFVFGGSQGLLVAQAEAFEPSTETPPVVVTEWRVKGQRQPVAGLDRGLRVPPGTGQFSVEFAALDYADPARTRYAHRLDGVDPDWIESDATQRLASYGGLAPGHYVLHVRGSNRAGLWSPHTLAIPVQVLPAWWQTAGFRSGTLLVGILTLIAVVAGLVHWRTASLRRRHLALEQRVADRTLALRSMTDALRQKSAELEEASLTDPLTGLRNRRYLAQHIEADLGLSLRRWSRGEPPDDADLVFFLADLDGFKQLNDRWGHAAGDAVLRQLRGRLQQVFRDSDHLVRWGGEEFLIVARGTSRRSAPELAERLRAAVADLPFRLDDGRPLSCTCSVGFAAYPVDTSLPHALGWEATVACADAALFAAKAAGRNGWYGLIRASVGPTGSTEAVRARVAVPAAQWPETAGLETAASPGLVNPPAGA